MPLLLKVSASSKKWTAGYQPRLACQLTGTAGDTPPSISSLAFSPKHNLYVTRGLFNWLFSIIYSKTFADSVKPRLLVVIKLLYVDRLTVGCEAGLAVIDVNQKTCVWAASVADLYGMKKFTSNK